MLFVYCRHVDGSSEVPRRGAAELPTPRALGSVAELRAAPQPKFAIPVYSIVVSVSVVAELSWCIEGCPGHGNPLAVLSQVAPVAAAWRVELRGGTPQAAARAVTEARLRAPFVSTVVCHGGN